MRESFKRRSEHHFYATNRIKSYLKKHYLSKVFISSNILITFKIPRNLAFNKPFEPELELFQITQQSSEKNTVQWYSSVVVVLMTCPVNQEQTWICNLYSSYFATEKNPARIFKCLCPSSRNHMKIYLHSSKYSCKHFDYLRVIILKWSMYIRWGNAKVVMSVISVQHFSQGEFSVCSIFKIQSLTQATISLFQC